MSQSPLQRSARRPLKAFAHVPSNLSKQPSTPDLASAATGTNETDHDEPVHIHTPSSSKSLAKARASYASAGVGPSSQTTSSLTPSQSTPTLHRRTQPHAHADTSLLTPARRPLVIAGSQTPIHYSPYAFETPPTGLSRSASVPFDMAASARAARLASQSRVEADQGADGTPGLGIEKERKGRRKSLGIVRKKSLGTRAEKLKTRIIEAPGNLLETLSLNIPTSIDELLPEEHYAHPIALITHMIHFLCIAPLWSRRQEGRSILRSVSDKSRSVGGRWDDWEEKQSGGWAWGLYLFTFSLFLLSIANAVYLFTRFRKYDMQLRPASEPVSSPHASPIAAPRPKAEDPFVESTTHSASPASTTPAEKVLRILGRVVLFLAKSIFAAIMSMLGRPTETPISPFSGQGEDRIQSLRVWDPPDFCLAFFCAYPPSAPLLAHLLTLAHPLLTPILHLTSAMLLTHLALNFRQLVKDRQLLAAEVMKEYDRKFVYRKIFGGRVDRGVQTSEAEMVY